MPKNWDLEFLGRAAGIPATVTPWIPSRLRSGLGHFYSTFCVHQEWGGETMMIKWGDSILEQDSRDHSILSCFICCDRVFFPWRRIWWNKTPSRVVSFVWMTAAGKISTKDNLSKRHIIVVEWRCMYMCKETKQPLVAPLWIAIFQLLGIEWVIEWS